MDNRTVYRAILPNLDLLRKFYWDISQTFFYMNLARMQPLRIINKFKTNVRVATGADLQ